MNFKLFDLFDLFYNINQMSNTHIKGKEFVSKYSGIKFYKLTNHQEIHNNLKFNNGLNIDPIAFNPSNSCLPGGIYFTERNKIAMWLHYSDSPMCWIREVQIPLDAEVYIEDNKFKSNKIILGPRVTIKDFEGWNDSQFCNSAVKINGLTLQFVKNQNKQNTTYAVEQNASSFVFVNKQFQSEQLCLIAIKHNPHALKYIDQSNQTPEICALAIKQNPRTLQWVKN